MRFTVILLLIANLYSFGQDTIFYNKIASSFEGDNISITYKSRVTGMVDTTRLRDGLWTAYDSLGNKIYIRNYQASKRRGTSIKNGLEMYFDPHTGDTLMYRNYYKGSLQEQLGTKAAILAVDNTVFHIYKDFGSFTVAEYKLKYNGRVDFTTIWKSSIEDPRDILNDKSYLEFEKELGDPSLLEPPSFSTKAEYNYVSNPEFENHPGAYFSIMSFTNQVAKWSVASISPDFYLSNVGALSGNSFAGIRVFSLRKDIEYIQNELRDTLVKDSIYCFSAYLRLSPGSRYASNAFGFLVSTEKQFINTDEVLTVRPSKHLKTQVLNYKTDWMKVQCTYKAKGGERYLTLGSFQNHKELKLEEVPGKVHESYYYIDDVSLVPIAKEEDCACNFADTRVADEPTDSFVLKTTTPFDTLKKGDNVVLDNIHFDNDESRLLPQSYSTLFEVLTFMKNNGKVKVEISGHTSNTGGLTHNMVLSSRRAISVRKFLTKNGISEERIVTEGYGPKFPIADNETKEGQRENRRVEFRILSL